MMTNEIRNLIQKGKQLDQQTGSLHDAILDFANRMDKGVTEQQVQGVMQFITEYVEHAPALIDLIEETAAGMGKTDRIRPMTRVAEGYFLTEDDLIPDHLGLVGLLDDAYLTHSLIQAMADRHRAKTGLSLLPIEMHEINGFVRKLIGEPNGSLLDNYVAATLRIPEVQQNMLQTLEPFGEMNLSTAPDPMWGDASIAEIVEVRIGVMYVS